MPQIQALELEHQQYKEFCSELRPGYEPPSRHKIGNEILECVYKSELDKSMNDIIGKSVCMDLDG